MATKQTNKKRNGNGPNPAFEAQLWAAADALRNNMDAAEYKHVVLGLIFLKYISDAFGERQAELVREKAHGADPEDPDEYRAANVFWVPGEARWSVLKDNAKQPTIGKTVDDAMAAIERDNPTLKGVLPKDYGRPNLDKQRLGQLIDLVTNIALGDQESRSKDVLGRVYEYFLSQFASAEGKKGGQFYTPSHVVRVLVEVLAPYRGRVYHPCCGSGGMFVSSEKFIEAHQGKIGDISIYGQESNYTTWRLCKMNLAIRGIEGKIEQGDSFHNDKLPDLKADYVLANPPFNDSDWRGEQLREDKRCRFRDRRGEMLFIDARKMGTMIDRVHRELTDQDVAKISGTYHAWRGDKGAGAYADALRVQDLSGVDRFHVHQLRHTFACRWLEQGGSLEALRQILGHSTVRTTERYGRISDDLVRAEAQRVHTVARTVASA
jgi:type I restriction-modification system DNA methylase subunit